MHYAPDHDGQWTVFLAGQFDHPRVIVRVQLDVYVVVFGNRIRFRFLHQLDWQFGFSGAKKKTGGRSPPLGLWLLSDGAHLAHRARSAQVEPVLPGEFQNRSTTSAKSPAIGSFWAPSSLATCLLKRSSLKASRTKSRTLSQNARSSAPRASSLIRARTASSS